MGAELAVKFVLSYGGAEMHVANNPCGQSSHERLIGHDAAKRLAAVAHRLQRRVPLAGRWLCAMPAWQGRSAAGVARTLRITDVTARRCLREAAERQGAGC